MTRHESFEFPNVDWNNMDGKKISRTDDTADDIPAFRNIRSSTSTSSFDQSFTLSKDFQTMSLDTSFENPLRGHADEDMRNVTFSNLLSAAAAATAAARLEKTRPSSHRQCVRSKSDAAKLSKVSREDSARSVRRTSSDGTDLATRNSSFRQNSIRRHGRDSQHLLKSSSRVNLAVLDTDSGLQTASEHFKSSSRRDIFRNNDGKHHHNSRSTIKKPIVKRIDSLDAEETVLASTLGTSVHLIIPSNNDNENLSRDKNEEMPQPRVRKLVRRNSFVNLRRASSSRSLARNAHCDRAKAKATALAARVMAKTGQGLALQCKPSANDDSSLTDSSESNQPTLNRQQPLKVPIFHGERHPVLCLLSDELWSDDKVIVEGALKQLEKICQKEDQNKSIFMLAGYSPLCGVIRKWYHDKEIQIAGFRLMQNATESFALGAFGCGALESIVCAMENFATNGPLQAEACGTLATIVSTSKSAPSIRLAIDLKGSSVLIKAMESFPDSIEVQQKAARTFFSMARFPELREHHLEVGTSVVVRESLEKFATTSLAADHVRVQDSKDLWKTMIARGA